MPGYWFSSTRNREFPFNHRPRHTPEAVTAKSKLRFCCGFLNVPKNSVGGTRLWRVCITQCRGNNFGEETTVLTRLPPEVSLFETAVTASNTRPAKAIKVFTTRKFVVPACLKSYMYFHSCVINMYMYIVCYGGGGVARPRDSFASKNKKNIYVDLIFSFSPFGVFQMKRISKCLSRPSRNWTGVWTSWRQSKRTVPFRTWPRLKYV